MKKQTETIVQLSIKPPSYLSKKTGINAKTIQKAIDGEGPIRGKQLETLEPIVMSNEIDYGEMQDLFLSNYL